MLSWGIILDRLQIPFLCSSPRRVFCSALYGVVGRVLYFVCSILGFYGVFFFRFRLRFLFWVSDECVWLMFFLLFCVSFGFYFLFFFHFYFIFFYVSALWCFIMTFYCFSVYVPNFSAFVFFCVLYFVSFILGLHYTCFGLGINLFCFGSLLCSRLVCQFILFVFVCGFLLFLIWFG